MTNLRKNLRQTFSVIYSPIYQFKGILLFKSFWLFLAERVLSFFFFLKSHSRFYFLLIFVFSTTRRYADGSRNFLIASRHEKLWIEGPFKTKDDSKMWIANNAHLVDFSKQVRLVFCLKSINLLWKTTDFQCNPVSTFLHLQRLVSYLIWLTSIQQQRS